MKMVSQAYVANTLHPVLVSVIESGNKLEEG